MIGGAYGGGVEMILNCDMVIASQDAKFALPEVKRGVVAAQGGKYFFSWWHFLVLLIILFEKKLGIPRLSQIVGHQVNIHSSWM